MEKAKEKEGLHMEIRLINALGEACPLPVIKTMKVLNEVKTAQLVQVQVDNEAAVKNLIRLAESRGLKAAAEKKEEKLFVVSISALPAAAFAVPVSAAAKAQGEAEGPGEAEGSEEMNEPEAACHILHLEDTVVAVGSDCMGSGDDELGRTLMKGYLYALSQSERLPKTLLFYNGGVKLTVNGAVSVEDLKTMEAMGVQILACGTCLNYYGLTEELAVGSVTNMYEITEAMNNASKVIRP